MENPRPEKVAVVEEVRGRLATATASVVTEYRGLTVAQLAELRKNLAGIGDYKIYKNTLVRLAIAGSEYEDLSELLSGPTAITFVNGEISAAAKTLRDFARTNPALIVKGGLVGGSSLSNQDFARLADLPSRDVLLARFAGALAAPLQQLAGLLQALPRNLAYGLSALIEARGGAPAPAEDAAPAEDEPAAVTLEAESEASGVDGSSEGSSAEAEAPAEAEAEAEAEPEVPAEAEPEVPAEVEAEVAEVADVAEVQVETAGGDESAAESEGEG
jgi:large subunit ribosomal protein L10